jgi:Tol biopolymer transport system component
MNRSLKPRHSFTPSNSNSLSRAPYLIAAVVCLAAYPLYQYGVQRSQAAALSSKSVIYSAYSGDGSHQADTVTSRVVGDSSFLSTLTLPGFSKPSRTFEDAFDRHEKEIFLAPDRNTLAVTVQSYESHGEALTFLADLTGKRLTEAHAGSFVSWEPDSSRAMLFLSGATHDAGRAIFFLAKDGSYSDSGLPVGVISANRSTANGAVAYSLTADGTDASDIWVRSMADAGSEVKQSLTNDSAAKSSDTLLRKGEGETFAWLRFSPDGMKLAFMTSKLGKTTPDSRTLWVMNADGTDARQISSILWNYPAQWSPDSAKLLFAVQEDADNAKAQDDEIGLKSNLWEYDMVSRASQKLTNLADKRILHPSYSGDGSQIIFVSDQSGEDEVWILEGKTLSRVTDGEDAVDGKRYPILP